MKKEKKNMASADRPLEVKKVEEKKVKSIRFIDEVKAEITKVSWTPKAELSKLTKITLASIFAGSFLIFGIDVILRSGMMLITSFARWITG